MKFLQIKCHKDNELMIQHIKLVFKDHIHKEIHGKNEILFKLKYETDNEIFEKAALVGAKNISIMTWN